VIAFAAACGGESAIVTPDGSSPQLSPSAAGSERTLAVELTAPGGADAGMIFSIEGPNILSVSPAAGIDLVSARTESGGRTRIDVVAVGPLTSGVVAWLTVKGVNSGNPFTATVTQVAAGATDGFVQRNDLQAYRLVVRR
jgi:hypothetical protein